MSTISNTAKSIKADESKLLKIFKAIKKFVAKEFLLILIIVIVSIPLAYMLELELTKKAPDLMEALLKTFQGSGSFMILYTLCVAGLYFSRVVLGALQTLVKSKSKKS